MLKKLTATPSMLEQWQDRRFKFAYQVGDLLVGDAAKQPSIAGPAIYGVYLAGIGLVYVGQTQEAQRRLRDLPIGESHHVPTTIPPEIWERVVVVQWPQLLESTSAEQKSRAATLGLDTCGLALEHLLQARRTPQLNGRTRTTLGTWRLRRLAHSRSRGAISASQCLELFGLVDELWCYLESVRPASSSSAEFRITHKCGRVVFPSALLAG